MQRIIKRTVCDPKVAKEEEIFCMIALTLGNEIQKQNL